MNKRKVALALVAAFVLNTISTTVGNINGQARIAYAQDLRLSEQDLYKMSYSIKRLYSSIVKGNNSVALKFHNIDSSKVEDVTFENVTYQPFNERKSLNENFNGVISGKWDKNTSTCVLNEDIIVPGIYTGDVNITFKDGSKESYRLSLRKRPSDYLDYRVDVKAGKITISDLKIKDNTDSINKNVKAVFVKYNDETEMSMTLNDKQEIVISSLDVSSGKFNKDDKINIRVVYGQNGEYEINSEFLLVDQQNPTIDHVFVTNYRDFVGENLKAQFQDVFGKNIELNLVTPRNIIIQPDSPLGNFTDENQKVTTEVKTIYADYNNAQKQIVSYKQTYGNKKEENDNEVYLGGALADVKVVNNNDGKLKLNIRPKAININFGNVDYFVPYVFITNLHNSKIGETEEYKGELVGNYSAKFSKGTPNVRTYYKGIDTKEIKINSESSKLEIAGLLEHFSSIIEKLPTFELDLTNEKLDQGYNSIEVEFSVDSKNDRERVKEKNAQNGSDADARKDAFIFPSSDPDSVYTSIVFVVDKLDAEKVVPNTSGESVNDANGVLEVVNLTDVDIDNKADSETEFVIDARFSNGIGKVTIDDNDSNSVVADNFNEGNHIIKNNITTGKYQGVYEAGIIAKKQVFLLDLVEDKSKRKETSISFNTIPTFGEYDKSGISRAVIRYNYGTDVWGEKEITLDDNKNGSVTVTDLEPGKKYIFVAVYETKDGRKIQSNFDEFITIRPFMVDFRDIKLTKNTIGVNVLPNFDQSNLDKSKISSLVVKYREKNVGDSFKTHKTFNGEDARNEKGILLPNLKSDTTYEIHVTYTYNDGISDKKVSDKIEVKTSLDNGNGGNGGNGNNGNNGNNGSNSGTIIENISGSMGGSSCKATTVNGAIVVNTDNNTIKGSTYIISTLQCVKYESLTTPVAITITYKEKDGQVITEKTEDFSNVKVSFDGEKVKVEGLVPGKQYEEIIIEYKDKSGKMEKLILNKFVLKSDDNLERYIANVYNVVFNRSADENGYHFHLDNLKEDKVSLRDFLLNMLWEKEFLEIYKTPESKVEALYNGIVGRNSEKEGREFWVSEYRKMLKVCGSETETLKSISDMMVNEKELREIASILKVRW